MPPLVSVIPEHRQEIAMKLVRYLGVSVVGVVSTQTLLLLLLGPGHMDAVPSNVVAVTLTSVPTYLLNRAWVWQKRGRSHMTREVLPFWGMTLAGLALSTVFVALVDQRTDRAIPVMLANLAGFAVLWVVKFLVLEHMLFGGDDETDT